MEILYNGVWCRPFSNYWALPTPSTQCSAATNHLITNAVFNLSSDLIMLAIGCSLFIRTNLPWSRKIILTGIFGVGVFVILAAVLNKYYSFTHPFSTQWTFWYVRESSTAVIVANLPFLWTLLRRMFKLDAFDAEHYGQHSVPFHTSRSARGRHAKSQRESHSHGAENHYNGSVQKGGSQDSSLDLKHLDLRQITSNKTSGASQVPPKPVYQPSWREQGVFGRGDQELMADLEPFDSASDNVDSAVPSPRSSRRNSVPIIGTGRQSWQSPSSGASSPRKNGASSPRREGASSPGLRRIRDEEAQYKIQEDVGQRCSFYEGPPDSEEEERESAGGRSRKSSEFDSNELEFQTSALEPDAQAGSQRLVAVLQQSHGSGPRHSVVDRVAPPLWEGT